MKLFTNYQIAIIEFCARECERQGSGEASVAWMLNAYNYAAERWAVDKTITVEDILIMAAMIEPEKNANGFRRVNVSFRNLSVVGWENIDRQIANLLAAQDSLDALSFYTELEKIHPLLDGNGRLGAILYNVLNTKLFCPVTPPEVAF
jgi:Fic family protein